MVVVVVRAEEGLELEMECMGRLETWRCLLEVGGGCGGLGGWDRRRWACEEVGELGRRGGCLDLWECIERNKSCLKNLNSLRIISVT